MNFLTAFGPLIFIFAMNYLFGKQAKEKKKVSDKSSRYLEGANLKNRPISKGRHHRLAKLKTPKKLSPIDSVCTHKKKDKEQFYQVTAGEAYDYYHSNYLEKDNRKVTTRVKQTDPYLKVDQLNKPQITKKEVESDLSYKNKRLKEIRSIGHYEARTDDIDEEQMVERNWLQDAIVMKEILDKPVALRRR